LTDIPNKIMTFRFLIESDLLAASWLHHI